MTRWLSSCFLTCALIVCLLAADAVRGEDWPGWRGPRGDGTSLEESVPVKWDGTTGENIRWKTPLPAEGHASPVVWDDRVFLTGCNKQTLERVLMCFDRTTGELRWQQSVVKSPLETKHGLNSFASGTPATDGKLVFVTFLEVDGSTVPAPNVGTPRPITPGQMVVAAYDFDGHQKWLVRPGGFISAHGFCSCPVLFENLVILNGDHDGDSYIVALDKATGEIVWKTPRVHKTRSYVTPLIRDIDGRTQMVFSGSKSIVSLNPKDGTTYWTIEGPTEQFVASMVYDGSLFFMAAGFPTYHVMGIRPDGRGDVTGTHVVWHDTDAKCYVPSPVLAGEFLYVADDRGTGNCFRAATGERIWKSRLGKHFSSSLIAAGGLVYFTADEGQTTVVRPSDKPEPEIVAVSQLGEQTFASPAVSHGCIFLRGEQHLFCIGAKE